MEMRISSISSVGQNTPARAASGTGFDGILREQIAKSQELKFSRHACERMESRNITISPEQYTRIKDAVDKAQEAGASDSVVVTDRLALVVSVTNRTVITCMDRDSAAGNVFTNIDSVALV